MPKKDEKAKGIATLVPAIEVDSFSDDELIMSDTSPVPSLVARVVSSQIVMHSNVPQCEIGFQGMFLGPCNNDDVIGPSK